MDKDDYNKYMKFTHITFTDAALPESFDGFKILHLSDLHNRSFSDKELKKLLSKIQDFAPDIIVATGDIIDRRRPNIMKAYLFMQQLARIAKIFYVTGNHEAATAHHYALLQYRLKSLGIIILENYGVYIKHNNQKICIAGLEDYRFFKVKSVNANEYVKQTLESMIPKEAFCILLSHHPEFFDIYANSGVNLTLCGHAHGGQIRLPLIGGLYAPNQGIFPKYTNGLYKKESGGAMIVSRGMANSSFPIRIFNSPHVIGITLKRPEQTASNNKEINTIKQN